MNGGMLAAFVVAAAVIQLSPGPGMLFVLAQGATGGPRCGVVAACGAAATMVVHTAGVVLGLAAVLAQAPVVLAAVRVGGTVYLLWLAVRTFSAPPPEPVAAARNSQLGRVFLRAALNNLLNPKMIVFYLVFLPQFVDPSLGGIPLQLLVLGLVLLLTGLLVDLIIGSTAGQIGRLLQRRPAVGRTLNKFAGTAYGVLAVRLAVEAS